MEPRPTDEVVRNELRRLIRREDQRVADSFPGGGRHAVIDLARAMEDLTTQLDLHPEERAASEGRIKLYLEGWNRALGLFLDASCRDQGVPLTPSTEEAEGWADWVLRNCGRISQSEFVLGLWDTGLIELVEAKSGVFRFAIASRRSGIERVEREDLFWLQNYIVDRQKPQMDRLLARFDDVARSMTELVRPSHDHCIAYGTTPEIDSFFDDWATLHARTLTDHDSFPGDAIFGGLEFDIYRIAAEIMMGIALKHRHFCLALLAKHPEIRRRDIQAMPRSTEKLVQVLEGLLEIDRTAAKQVLDTFVLTDENKDYHCASSSVGYRAPLIKVGSDDALLSTFGSLDSSYSFVLGELRRRYRGDWDSATLLREKVFRDEIYQVFPQPQMSKLDRSVLLRENGRIITDVDASILDRRTGTLGLFQLKWQDLFGDSMRKRSSRKKNFYKTANGWVEAVGAWIEGKSPDEVARALGFHGPAASGVRSVRLFVVGRTFSGFSGEDVPDERAAWGLWPQVVRLMIGKSASKDPINDLFGSLKDDAPVHRLPISSDGVELQRLALDGALIVIESPKAVS